MTQWLEKLRAEARVAFDARGFPTRRVEDWKYSDLSRALGQAPSDACEAQFSFVETGARVIEIVDGVCGAFPVGEEIVSLRAALGASSSVVMGHLGKVNPDAGHPILNLNTAVMEDGVVIHVRKNVVREGLTHLRYRWTDKDVSADGHHLRVLVVLEEGAQARLLETHEGPGAQGLATVVTEVSLGAGARLIHTRMEALGPRARQAAVLTAQIGRDAALEGFYLARGAAFARHEIRARLAGEGAHVGLDGIYVVGDARHNDNTTVIEHAVPHTTSRQMFRGVLSGEARGVFQGKVVVKPGAQKTDAQQQSRAILLSRRAEIDTKPELEILADDVKCSHGATAGELDPAALFFLRARGIPEREARALLVEGFLEQGLEAIADGELRALAQRCVRNWLDTHALEVPDAGQR